MKRSYLKKEYELSDLTYWHNPLSVSQSVRLCQDRVGRVPGSTTYKEVIWQPDETKAIHASFDEAIHEVVNGVIVGGLAPQLVKVKQIIDNQEIECHEQMPEIFDPDKVKAKKDMQELMTRMAQKSAVEAAVKMQTAEVAVLKDMDVKKSGRPKKESTESK